MSMNDCDPGSIGWARDELQQYCKVIGIDIKDIVSGAVVHRSELVNNSLCRFKEACLRGHINPIDVVDPKSDPRLSFIGGEWRFDNGNVIMASSDGINWYKKYEKCTDQEGG